MWRAVARVLAWLVTPALLAGTSAAGLASGSGTGLSSADALLVVAMLSCWVVGVVVTAQAPEKRAGWAFLGLGSALAWSSCWDVYADLGQVHGLDVPAWRLAAVLDDTSWIWWFAFLALVLLATVPPAPSRYGRALPAVTLGSAVVFQVCALLRSTPLDPPREELTSPWAVDALDTLARLLAWVAVYLVLLCVVSSVFVLVAAFRRAEGETRRRLLWLVAGAVPLVPSAVGAYVASVAGRNDVATVLLGAAMVTLVAGATLSVLRYRLYDVEQVVTESGAYAIASVSVVVAFVVALVVLSRSADLDTGSPPAVVLATLAGVAVARASYVWGRRAVGRRVNRSRYDAVQAVRTGLASDADLDALVVSALGPGARVLYPAADGAWVTTTGVAVPPGATARDVRRGERVVARLEYDDQHVEADVVAAVATEAAAEVDNVALRAELARQVALISESRERLATGQLEERRRIERDLHDGAQQRLLAIALQLRSARLNGDGGVLRDEADRAIEDLQATVQELRSISAGLQPAALVGGGLRGAVADMALRSPVPLEHHVVDTRFSPRLESAAWFVIAEAVTNAVKHADAHRLSVQVRHEGEGVAVTVCDDGRGGADPSGSGLEGLADRVAAVGGCFRVVDVTPTGTLVEAVFPCAS